MLAALLVLVGLPVVYFGGGWIYSLIIGHRKAAWEGKVERNDTGVLSGAEEYTVGEGAVAILFVHGFGDTPAVYREMSTELASRGFLCRAVRLPGFGEPAGAFKGKTHLDWVSDLREEVLALKASGRPVWLAAHSLGAAVALCYASRYDDVQGLVAMAPLTEVADDRSPILPARTWFNILTRTMPWLEVVENPFPPTTNRVIEGPVRPHDAFFPVGIYRELFNLIDDIQQNAENISLPILLILSPTDPVVKSKSAKKFLSRTSSKRLEVKMAKASGHLIPMDNDWKQVVDWIESFIHEVSDARGEKEI